MANNRTPVYCTRNKIYYTQDFNETFGSTCQAIIFVQDSAGNFTIPLNPDAPLISTNYGQSEYTFSIDQVLGASNIFEKVPAPEPENTVRFLDNFLVPYKVQTKILGSSVAAAMSSTFLAINAKIKADHYFHFKDGSTAGQNFMEDYIGGKQGFLNNAPTIKTTSLKATELLSFAFNINPCPPVIQIVAYIVDINNQKSKLIVDKLTVSENDVLEMNVSYTKIRQLSQVDLKRYIIYLQDESGNKISDDKMYYIDTVENEDEEQILFKNLFGVWDSIRLLSNRSESKEVERLSFENEYNESIDYYQRGTTKFTFRTGPLERGYLKYIGEELLFSPEIYYQGLRINCTTNSLEVFNPVAHTEGAALEFTLATSQQF